MDLVDHDHDHDHENVVMQLVVTDSLRAFGRKRSCPRLELYLEGERFGPC